MSVETEDTAMNGGEDSIPLDEGGETRLPIVEVLTGRGFITGKSGSGKSNSASVVVEELLDRGFPVMIVDTDGEYWGLKEEYEILHVGADEECDLQVGPEHAEKLADLALSKSVPIILDVSGYLDEEEASALVRETAAALFAKEKKLNKPFLLLVEEIHEYLPEGRGSDETAQMLTRVAKRGRKRGLGLCGMSQRPADVKKDFITQCDWLMWHRLTWENDTKVVGRVVGNDYREPVQDLADGEALLMADFLDEDLLRVQVRRKRTFDAGATPDLGDYERPELKSVGSDLVDELEEISQREERRQDRITELETEVERLESEKADLREELEDARDMTDMAQQFTEAMMQSEGGDGATSEKVDELVEERNELRRDLESRDDRIEALEQRVSELQRYEERVEQLDALDIGEAEEALERLQEALNIAADGEAAKYREKLQNARARIEELEADEEEPPEPDVVEHPAVRRQVSNIKSTVDDLDEKALKMLEWYRYYGPGEAGDAYFHAGGKRSSRRRYDHNKPLREAGLIEKDGQGIYRYAAPDRVREQFEDNPQVDEDAVEALIGEIEAKIEEVTPTDE